MFIIPSPCCYYPINPCVPVVKVVVVLTEVDLVIVSLTLDYLGKENWLQLLLVYLFWSTGWRSLDKEFGLALVKFILFCFWKAAADGIRFVNGVII